MNQFLNGLGLHQDPELDFKEDSFLSIREGKRRVKYFFADPNVITSPPDKTLTLPTEDLILIGCGRPRKCSKTR